MFVPGRRHCFKPTHARAGSATCPVGGGEIPEDQRLFEDLY
jgi:hypothetical protein